MVNWNERLRAGGLHLCLSLIVATLAAALVFALWYPYPYREISGGRELFLLVVGVDVFAGPLITLIIFNRSKPRSELRRDLGFVGLLQVAFLGYGLWSVAVARPVHLVFEIDRFRVVHAVDVPQELLDRSPPKVQALPWNGPTLLAVRPFRNANESADAIVAALGGVAIGARPDFWETYDEARATVRQVARPVSELKARFGKRSGEIDAALQASGRKADSTAYLPLVGRNSFWTIFLDPATANVVGFLRLDPF